MTAPHELPCPFCTALGRPGIAKHLHNKSPNARYACPACGCRFTMSMEHLEAAITRRLGGEVPPLPLTEPPPPPPRRNGHEVRPDSYYLND